jgi:hypothetical protein
MISALKATMVIANGVRAGGGKESDRSGMVIGCTVSAQLRALELRRQGEESDPTGLALEECQTRRADGVRSRRKILAWISRLEMDASGRVEAKAVRRTCAKAHGALEHDAVDLRSLEGRTRRCLRPRKCGRD